MPETNENAFSHAYFLSEAASFKDQMGTLSFWRLTEDQRENALKGLLYVYTHVRGDTEDEARVAASFMEILMQDFARRGMLVPMHPKLAA